MALHDVAAGAVVRKYGQPIGIATQPIRAGEHVHSHNLAVGEGATRAARSARVPRALLPRLPMRPSRAMSAPMGRWARAIASPSSAA
jgi:hypothetical protein